jgi:hypothetical protein
MHAAKQVISERFFVSERISRKQKRLRRLRLLLFAAGVSHQRIAAELPAMAPHNGGNDGRASKAHIRRWGKAPRAHDYNRRISTNSEEYPQRMLHELVTRAAAFRPDQS